MGCMRAESIQPNCRNSVDKKENKFVLAAVNKLVSCYRKVAVNIEERLFRLVSADFGLVI